MEFKARTIGMTDGAKGNLDAAAKSVRLSKFEVLSILLESLDIEDVLSVNTDFLNLKIEEYRDKKLDERRRKSELRAKISKLSDDDIEKMLNEQGT